jgi:hypothetical protein
MKKILIGIIILVILFLGYALFGNYSSGERAGTVAKLSQRGIIFKTYEGQLNTAGLSGDTGSPSSLVWDFSVGAGDKEVIKNLEEALRSGKRVNLHYKEKFFRFFWQGDSKYYVYQVDKVQ